MSKVKTESTRETVREREREKGTKTYKVEEGS